MKPLRVFTSSVQVMLFSDRLDVMNTGRLPPPLTVEKLRVAHESLPRNPLLAEPMYLAGYIGRMGTGTVDMIQRCAAANLREPEFAAGEGFVTTIWRPNDASRPAGVQDGGKVEGQAGVQAELSGRDIAMLQACVQDAATGGDLRTAANYSARTKSFEQQLARLMADGLLEMTIPDKPTSPLQKYRLTERGRTALASLP